MQAQLASPPQGAAPLAGVRARLKARNAALSRVQAAVQSNGQLPDAQRAPAEQPEAQPRSSQPAEAPSQAADDVPAEQLAGAQPAADAEAPQPGSQPSRSQPGNALLQVRGHLSRESLLVR